MTLEELIRYALEGMALSDNLTQQDFIRKIEPLIDILIDYPNDTDKDIRSILSSRWKPYTSYDKEDPT